MNNKITTQIDRLHLLLDQADKKYSALQESYHLLQNKTLQLEKAHSERLSKLSGAMDEQSSALETKLMTFIEASLTRRLTPIQTLVHRSISDYSTQNDRLSILQRQIDDQSNSQQMTTDTLNSKLETTQKYLVSKKLKAAAPQPVSSGNAQFLRLQKQVDDHELANRANNIKIHKQLALQHAKGQACEEQVTQADKQLRLLGLQQAYIRSIIYPTRCSKDSKDVQHTTQFPQTQGPSETTRLEALEDEVAKLAHKHVEMHDTISRIDEGCFRPRHKPDTMSDFACSISGLMQELASANLDQMWATLKRLHIHCLTQYAATDFVFTTLKSGKHFKEFFRKKREKLELEKVEPPGFYRFLELWKQN